MKRKEAIQRDLENIGNKIQGLKEVVKTNRPIRDFMNIIRDIEDRLEQVSSYVEAEK